MNALLKATGDLLSRRLRGSSGASAQPLLEREDLLEIERHARALPHSLFEFRQQSAAPLPGDSLSRLRGHGLEFEENRPYQAGDETRLINWRMYARSGKLYTRVYAEERRPQLYVLVDRRAAMRFGTRRQLKAALAARIAACHVYQAIPQAIAAGGLVLDTDLTWFDPASGATGLEPLLRQLAAPCPPLAFDGRQPILDQALRMLAQRSRAGGYVLLVSDFCDFDPHSTTPLLHQLAQQHSLHAIEITDPVERQLPTSGEFRIEDRAADRPLWISGRDPEQQRAYRAALESHRTALAAGFRRCGIRFTACSTASEYQDCLVPANGRRQRR